jgi:hypothetical protein
MIGMQRRWRPNRSRNLSRGVHIPQLILYWWRIGIDPARQPLGKNIRCSLLFGFKLALRNIMHRLLRHLVSQVRNDQNFFKLR